MVDARRIWMVKLIANLLVGVHCKKKVFPGHLIQVSWTKHHKQVLPRHQKWIIPDSGVSQTPKIGIGGTPKIRCCRNTWFRSHGRNFQTPYSGVSETPKSGVVWTPEKNFKKSFPTTPYLGVQGKTLETGVTTTPKIVIHDLSVGPTPKLRVDATPKNILFLEHLFWNY